MNRTVRAHVVVWLIVTVVGCGSAYADRLRNVQQGELIPPFSLTTLDGQTLESGTLRGKVVTLVFLAAAQRSSEGATRAAHEVVQGLHRKDVQLVFVTADTAHTTYFREHRVQGNLHEPFGLDFERQLYGQLGLIVLPTSLVIDGRGRLAQVISGFKSDYPHVLESYLRHTLGLIDDAQLEKQLTARAFRRDQPADRAARHRATARLLRQKGLLSDAERELRAALELDPPNADARLDLASLLILQNRVSDAARLVDEVLAANADDRRGRLMLGIVRFHQGKLDQAESILRQALLLNPDPVLTHYYLGRLYEKKGDKDQALTHYREALSRLLDQT